MYLRENNKFVLSHVISIQTYCTTLYINPEIFLTNAFSSRTNAKTQVEITMPPVVGTFRGTSPSSEANSSTMGTTGFTCSFVGYVAESTARLDGWIEGNKKKADDCVFELTSVKNDEQQKIDSLLRKLKSLQYERGVARESRESSGDPYAVGGLAERRKQFEEKEMKLEQEVSILKSKSRVEQSQLDGELAISSIVRPLNNSSQLPISM